MSELFCLCWNKYRILSKFWCLKCHKSLKYVEKSTEIKKVLIFELIKELENFQFTM